MQAGQYEQYQAMSKLYKQIVDSITTLELGQLKLFLVNLQKRIDNKETSLLAEYSSVKDLLDNTKEAKGKVPLHFAAAAGNVEVVRHLVQNLKLDYRVKDKQGNTPFFTAVEHGHLDLVNYFIQELKCSVNESKEGQITALHLASNHNHTQLITYLISKGADVQKISIYGKALNWAVGSGHLEAAKVLLENKANPNGDGTASSIAPLILAIDHNHKELYQLLIQKGAEVDSKDPMGYTALHLAAQKGQLAFVKDLVERGAQVQKEVEGKTPLYLAFEHGKWEVVNYLRSKMNDHEKVQAKWKEQTQKLKQTQTEPNKQKAEEIKNNGNKYYASKSYPEALQQYKKALPYDPTNDVIHRNIAACYLALKDYESALYHCQEAKKVDNKNIKTVYREAQAYQGLGDLIDAASSMWECCMIEPKNQMFRAQFEKIVEAAKKDHKSKENK